MQRRKVLAALAGSVGLAGCSGFDGLGGSDGDSGGVTAADDGPARFVEVSISAPSEVTAGESFGFEVSAANAGGSAGDFTATLTVEIGGIQRDTSITIQDVQPGSRKSKTFDGNRRAIVGELTLLITDYGAEQTISVRPAELSFGDSFDISSATLTIDSISYRSSFKVSSDSGPVYYTPDQGKVFGLISGRVDGNGEEIYGRGISVESGTLVTSRDVGRFDALADGIDVDGTRLAQLEGSGATWLLAEIEHGATANPALTWDAGGSEAYDARWSGSPDAPAPQIVVEDLQLPSSIPFDGGATGEFTVRNEGEGAGMVHAAIQRSTGGFGDSWKTLESIDRTVGADESFSPSFVLESDCVSEREVRVVPYFDGRAVEFTAADRSVGESFQAETGSRIRVETIRLTDQYRVPTFGGTRTVSSGSGSQFALVNVTASGDAPTAVSFSLETGSGTAGQKSAGGVSEILAPIEENVYGFGSGSGNSGILIYELDASVSRSDVAFVYNSGQYSDCQEVVRWG